MYSYYVYGLVIHSNLEVPALPLFPHSTVSESDIFFHFDPTPANFDVYSDRHDIYVDLKEDECVMFDRRYVLFVSKGGREVLIQPSETLNLRQIRLYILGTVLSVLLYQRGILSLHGSAMAIGDQVIGVIAPSGSGKSTTAGALYKKGYRLLSDDAIPIFYQDGRYVIYPGYPRLKISDEVADALDYSDARILERHPECGEVSFDATHQFIGQPLPLKQIYILGVGEELSIAPCSQLDAVFGMMPNSLPTMWLQTHSPEQFKQCTDLAKSIPFYRVTRSQNLEDLPKFADMLEAHFLNS